MTTKYGPPQGTREELWVLVIENSLEVDKLRKAIELGGSDDLRRENEQLKTELAFYKGWYNDDATSPQWPESESV